MPNQAIVVPAVYEAGVLKPLEPLPLPEHARVIITIGQTSVARQTAGMVPCPDPHLIEELALDPELDFDV